MQSNSVSIELSDAEIRTAIALYLQSQHPGCQGFDLELIGWDTYLDPGRLEGRCRLLPDLEGSDIGFAVRLESDCGSLNEIAALCFTESDAHEVAEQFLGKTFNKKPCDSFAILPMRRNQSGVWEQL